MPRKVKAKITREVVEIAIVALEDDGQVRDFIEPQEEQEHVDVLEVHEVLEVIDVW